MKFRLKVEYSFNTIDKRIYTYKLSQNKSFQANSNTNQDIRDKAKEVGGLGPCGRFLCCNLFLNDFDSVSINMAKNQVFQCLIIK